MEQNHNLRKLYKFEQFISFMGLFGNSEIKIEDPELKKLQNLVKITQQTLNSIKAEQESVFKSRRDPTLGGGSGLSQADLLKFKRQYYDLYKNLILQLNKIITDIEKRQNKL